MRNENKDGARESSIVRQLKGVYYPMQNNDSMNVVVLETGPHDKSSMNTIILYHFTLQDEASIDSIRTRRRGTSK